MSHRGDQVDLAAAAGELIREVVAAMAAHATVRDLAEAIPRPTDT
jgi:hypothetical protein